jgi:DNA invertase Pin-like site-specific DNA recombinase
MGKPKTGPGTRYVLQRDLAGESAEAIANVTLAIEQGGSVERAARLLGVPARTLARWLAKYPALKSSVDAARGSS